MSQDSSHILQQQVQQACRERTPLHIRGNGSKSFYGYPVEGERLKTRVHHGIVDYQPTELVLTARAGTALQDIDAALSRHGQMLGCEPPHFGKGSFGGMIASGLAGPRRPFAGGVADQILGCKILNGRGEILQFGGRVMKNVAGYDISRLMVGSLGCLGVILEATVKVMPRPKSERTFRFELSQDKTAQFINTLRGLGFPVSASCHDGQHLVVRFSAGREEADALPAALQQRFAFVGFAEESRKNFWHELREQSLDFFTKPGDLWRISLPPASPALELSGACLTEWNGALRWLYSEQDAGQVFEQAAQANGSANLYRSHRPQQAASIFQPLPEALMHWHRQLKTAFDPVGILNPGKLYREF